MERGLTSSIKEFSISTKGKCAVQFTKDDYEKYDYIIGMDSYNIRNINRIICKETAFERR